MVNNWIFIFFLIRNHTLTFLSILIEKPTIRSINGTIVSANTSSIGRDSLNTSGVVISRLCGWVCST